MIGWRPKSPPADPDEAAIWWSARRRLGLLSPRDEEAFAVWLEDPVNGLAWEATDGLIEAIGDVAASPDVRVMRDHALGAARWAPASLRRCTAWSAVAASLIAILFWIAQPFDRLGAPLTQFAQRYATQVGERRDLVLPDGSRVALNTASVIEIHYRADRRDVRLLKGQALFRVAKDVARPFVVAAGDRRITATGTAFDVRIANDGVVTVLLVEGHVVVDPVKREGFARFIPEIAREELAPGEKLSVSSAGGLTDTPKITVTDVVEATSWTRGQIIFRDDSLIDAATEMNRYSTTKLIIEDARVGQLRISGVFGVERGDNFVAAVSSFYPVDAERRSPGIIILKWRERAETDRPGIVTN